VQKELEVRRQLVDYESPVGMGPVPFPVPSNNFRREYHSCDRGDTVAKSVCAFWHYATTFSWCGFTRVHKYCRLCFVSAC
jgi:hypothetical protein